MQVYYSLVRMIKKQSQTQCAWQIMSVSCSETETALLDVTSALFDQADGGQVSVLVARSVSGIWYIWSFCSFTQARNKFWYLWYGTQMVLTRIQGKISVCGYKWPSVQTCSAAVWRPLGISAWSCSVYSVHATTITCNVQRQVWLPQIHRWHSTQKVSAALWLQITHLLSWILH